MSYGDSSSDSGAIDTSSSLKFKGGAKTFYNGSKNEWLVPAVVVVCSLALMLFFGKKGK